MNTGIVPGSDFPVTLTFGRMVGNAGHSADLQCFFLHATGRAVSQLDLRRRFHRLQSHGRNVDIIHSVGSIESDNLRLHAVLDAIGEHRDCT